MQTKHNRDDVEISLTDCLDYYQKAETLRGDKGLFCPLCKQQTESTSIKNIYSTKNVFILILDRNIGNDFNQTKIAFKETLNLRDYVQYKKEGEKGTRQKVGCRDEEKAQHHGQAAEKEFPAGALPPDELLHKNVTIGVHRLFISPHELGVYTV